MAHAKENRYVQTKTALFDAVQVLEKALEAHKRGRPATRNRNVTKALRLLLTAEEQEALAYALDLAHGDQELYLTNGNPLADYGKDWPTTRRFKADSFRHVANASAKLGFHGDVGRWKALATDVEEVKTADEEGGAQ